MTLVILYQIAVIYLAYKNAEMIYNDEPINHTNNALLHLLAAAIVLPSGLVNSISLLLLTRIVFDFALNFFRGYSLGYVSPRPASKIDKIEKKLFGNNGYLPKAIYLAALIAINIIW